MPNSTASNTLTTTAATISARSSTAMGTTGDIGADTERLSVKSDVSNSKFFSTSGQPISPRPHSSLSSRFGDEHGPGSGQQFEPIVDTFEVCDKAAAR